MATTEAITTGIMFLSTCPGYCTAIHDKLVPHFAVPYAAPIAVGARKRIRIKTAVHEQGARCTSRCHASFGVGRLTAKEHRQ